MTKQKLLMSFLYGGFVIVGFILGVALLNLKNKTNSTSPTKQDNEQNSNVSQPIQEEQYQVQKGDTLFSIGLKYNLEIQTLMKINNLSNADQIKVGQILKIPISEQSSSPVSLEDMEKLKEIQKLVNDGNQPWRLNPVEVVKTDSPVSYGFNALDIYNLTSKDDVKGEAHVNIEKVSNNKKLFYDVLLIQPVTTGSKGIWAIKSINKVK